MQEESNKQKQLATLMLQELHSIFLLLNLNVIDGKIISINQINVTPDLLETKIYISVYPNKEVEQVLAKIQEVAWEIKKKLVEKIKNKVRRIPTLAFYADDSLNRMYKITQLFFRNRKEILTKE